MVPTRSLSNNTEVHATRSNFANSHTSFRRRVHRPHHPNGPRNTHLSTRLFVRRSGLHCDASWETREPGHEYESGHWSTQLRNCTLGAALGLGLALTPPGLAVTTLTTQDLPPIPSSFPSLSEVHLPEYREVVLDNKLRVFLLEDHEVGLINGTLIMKGGARGDPADKVGISAVVAAVQRSGGTQAHPGTDLDNRLEDLAASIELGAGTGTVGVSFGGLSEDAEEILSLFAEVVRQPIFPEEKMALTKTQLLDRLEHRNDDPTRIPRRELAKVLYGADSVYAREPRIKDVASFSTADLKAYFRKWERPDNAVLGIVGDFDTDRMLDIVTQAFGDWSVASDQPVAPFPIPTTQAPPAAGSSIYLVDRPGASQASVAMGELGTLLDDPDIHSLDALNGMLNGFGGRLFNEVRSREGLAYSVSGGFAPGLDHPGTFVVGGETASPARFIEATKRVLNEARDQALPEAELETAKEKAMNSFVFNFADSGSQLNRIISYNLFDLPQDYLFQYIDGLNAVSTGSVLEASQRHMHPNDAQIVVVADAKSTESTLKKLGIPVRRLNVD